MEKTTIVVEKQPKLQNPVLIEGLPGLGFVGKIAAEHMIDQLKAQKFATLYSPDFPPQVMIQKDGTVKMATNDFYYHKKKTGEKHDIIIVVGDNQGINPRSHYEIIDEILNLAELHKTSRLYTLGGYGTGRMMKKPRVLGAATDKELVKEMKKHGVVFTGVSGAIVGAAGLLLGLGKLRNIPGVCLMGETHGQLADPNSSKEVLSVLSKILKIELDTKNLEKEAKKTEENVRKMQKAQSQSLEQQLMQSSKSLGEKETETYFR